MAEGTYKSRHRARQRALKKKWAARLAAARIEARKMIWLIACPQCGAGPGEQCIGADGQVLEEGRWQAHKKRKVDSGYRAWKLANVPKPKKNPAPKQARPMS